MVVTCHICKITLSDIDMESHINGKKHIRKAKMDVTFNNGKASRKQEEEMINTLPKTEKEPLIDKYSKAKKPWQTRQFKLRNTLPVNTKTNVPPAVIDKTLPFARQASNFIEQIQQTQEHHRSIQLVLRDVAKTFSRVFPNVMPLLFGSQLSGLAFKTSDIDVYLSDPHGGFQDKEFIRRNGRLIYKTRLFKNIIQIVNARVPIIKAQHIATGIELDISATSGPAVVNSVLIRFLLSHDTRIHALMMLVGYWAKKCNLINVTKFTRYSFNLLTIFYLQNIVNPILPPLCKIVSGVPGKMWPFHINEDKANLFNDNNLPLQDLFIGFFKFYKDFCFSKYIISTFLGQKIVFQELEKETILNQMIYYKMHLLDNGEKLQHKNICIQDPIELCCNTAKAVLEQTRIQFYKSCEKMCEMANRLNLNPQYWLYEMVHGTVAEPVVEQKCIKDLKMNLVYETKPGWTKRLTKTLCDFLISLGFTVSFDLPRGDIKKIKYSSDSIQFLLETTWIPLVNYIRLFEYLKKNAMTLEEYKSEQQVLNKAQTNVNKELLFSALCFIREAKTDRIVISFTNIGKSNRNYHRIAQMLMQCIGICFPKLTIENDAIKDSPGTQKLSKNDQDSSKKEEIKTSNQSTKSAVAMLEETDSTPFTSLTNIEVSTSNVEN